MPLVFNDPNTNQTVSSEKSKRIKQEMGELAKSIDFAKDLQQQAIENIDTATQTTEESNLAIIELFEGRESDKLALEEAHAKADATQKKLDETTIELEKANGEITALRASQEEMMQAIMEIYETGAGTNE